MTDKPIIMTVLFEARPGKEAELRKALTDVLAPTRKEDGFIQYDLHVHTGDGSRFVFYENWTSREHLDRHLSSPHLTVAIGTAGDWLAEPPSIETYWRIG